MGSKEDFTAAYVERVRQDTFLGLEVFFRDADLAPEVLSKYKPGIVIQETGFIDVSQMEGGPVAQVRYQIYTSKWDSFKQSFPLYRAWTMPRGCYFKVLDVYMEQEHAAVTLLHVPTYSVPYFAQNHDPEEENVAKEGRRRFGRALGEGPSAVMKEDYWRRRTAFPIGIDENGAFFFQFEEGGETGNETGDRGKGKGFWQKLFGR
jgi:hypothetical protein